MAIRTKCGAKSGSLACDREPHLDNQHRGHNDTIDEPMFWQDPSDQDVADAMTRWGGSFVKALGELWYRADPQNKERVRAAFPDYWQTYTKIAAEKRG